MAMLRVGRHDGILGHDSLDQPVLEPTAITEITVTPDDTLNDLLEKYREQQGLTAFHPSVVILLKNGQWPRELSAVTRIDASGQLSWFNPWGTLTLNDLSSVYPSGFHLDTSTDELIFAEEPQMGQGFDVDWHTLLEVYEAAIPWLDNALRVQGVTELAKLGIHGGQDVLTRLRRGVEAARQNVQRWRRRGGEPYSIREVLDDPTNSREDKSCLLGLPSGEVVSDLENILSPDEAIQRVIETMPVKDRELHYAVIQSSSLRSLRRPGRLICGCKYPECKTVGVVVATAHGLKIGLAQKANHFVVGNDALPVLAKELKRTLEMRWE